MFNFTTFNDGLIAPGYILITPYSPQPGSNLASGSTLVEGSLTAAEITEILDEEAEAIQNGPYVYDQQGVRQCS